MTLTLDTSYPQVLVDFFGDEAGFNWHARLLVVSDGSGRWIGATPNLGVELIDLTQQRVRALDRASPYPQDVVEEVYGFDELEEAQISEIARRCHALARVLVFGRQAVPEDDGVWRVADPSHPSYAEAVPEGALGDESTFVARGRCGFVRIDEEWTFAEFVTSQLEAAEGAPWPAATSACSRLRRTSRGGASSGRTRRSRSTETSCRRSGRSRGRAWWASTCAPCGMAA